MLSKPDVSGDGHVRKSTDAGAAVAVFIVLAMFLGLLLYTSAADLAIGTLVATAVCLPGIERLTRRADLFDPLVLMTLLFAIAVPFAVIYVVVQPGSALGTAFGTVPLTVLNKAMLLSSLAMGCLTAGFYLVVHLRSHSSRKGRDSTATTAANVATRLVWAYWATAIVRLGTLASGYGTSFTSATSGVNPLSNLVGVVSGLVNIVYPMTVLAILWDGQKRSFSRALPLLLTQVGIGAMAGSKATVLNAVIPFAFFLSQGLRKRRKASLVIPVLLVTALLATIVVFPVVSSYRQTAAIPGPEGLLSIIQARDDGGTPVNVLGRISWLPSIARVIMAVPQYIPFAYGGTIWPAFSWFVPRIIWPEKPVLSIGAWYAHEILGWDPSSRSEAAITLWGEAYLNFGIPGMIIAGLSMGMLFGYVYDRLYRRMSRPYTAMIYFLFISTFILGFERNVASLVGYFGQSVVLSYIIWRVAVSSVPGRPGRQKNIRYDGPELSSAPPKRIESGG